MPGKRFRIAESSCFFINITTLIEIWDHVCSFSQIRLNCLLLSYQLVLGIRKISSWADAIRFLSQTLFTLAYPSSCHFRRNSLIFGAQVFRNLSYQLSGWRARNLLGIADSRVPRTRRNGGWSRGLIWRLTARVPCRVLKSVEFI